MMHAELKTFLQGLQGHGRHGFHPASLAWFPWIVVSVSSCWLSIYVRTGRLLLCMAPATIKDDAGLDALLAWEL